MSGARIGLNYGVIPAVASMMELTVKPELFDDLRVMEGAALAAFASR